MIESQKKYIQKGNLNIYLTLILNWAQEHYEGSPFQLNPRSYLSHNPYCVIIDKDWN